VRIVDSNIVMLSTLHRGCVVVDADAVDKFESESEVLQGKPDIHS
jgi:hypothetical protein